MYLPRELLSHLYQNLVRTSHALSPPVLVLVALESDALCACRILTSLLKRDFIPHKIQPISGYGDLKRVWQELVLPMRTTMGGSGGVVVCLGLGGIDDIEADFFSEVETRVNEEGEEVLETRFDGYGGVECWVVDARRPWNLENMFDGMRSSSEAESDALVVHRGVERGKITSTYEPGRGGVICFDDGDIEQELEEERKAHAWMAEKMAGEEKEIIERIQTMSDEQIQQWAEQHERDDDDNDLYGDDRIPESGQDASRKRKSWSFDDDDSEDEPPAQRRRSNSSSPIPSSPRQLPRGRGLLVTGNRLGGSSDTSRSPSPIEGSASPAPRRRQRQSQLKDGEETWQLFIKYRKVLRDYEELGSSFSEPISSMIYSLASDLGREDNDLLWYAIVGVSSMELSGRTMTGVGLTPVSTAGGAAGWNGERGDRIRAVLRDEVRRLNPSPTTDIYNTVDYGIIQTHARSPNDNAIRLSPEPRFLLIRHWSLYDSMLHSPYLSAKLHVWSDAGRRRLHKLLAKMGVSLAQCRQSYTHMDMDLKRSLREKLLKFAPQYSLEGLIPPTTTGKEGWGFVRCWGWKACLSAVDVGVIVGAILEVGDAEAKLGTIGSSSGHEASQLTYSQRVQGMTNGGSDETDASALDAARADSRNERFWAAYDSLASVSKLTGHINTAQYLHRAILRTGTSLIEKKQIRHLKAFRMAVVKEGPDVQLFAHPGALVKLALWVAEAVVEMEGGRRSSIGGKGSDLVVAGLDEARGSYVVVGLGGGGAVALDKERQKRREEKIKRKEQRREEKRKAKQAEKDKRRERMVAIGEEYDTDDYEESEAESSDDDADGDMSDDEDYDAPKPRGFGRNKFGAAFQEVMEETGCRVRQDSFDHCVVDVKKEDLTGFLERLSEKMIEMIRLEKVAEQKARKLAEAAKASAAAVKEAEQEQRQRKRRESTALSDDEGL